MYKRELCCLDLSLYGNEGLLLPLLPSLFPLISSNPAVTSIRSVGVQWSLSSTLRGGHEGAQISLVAYLNNIRIMSAGDFLLKKHNVCEVKLIKEGLKSGGWRCRGRAPPHSEKIWPGGLLSAPLRSHSNKSPSLLLSSPSPSSVPFAQYTILRMTWK